MTSPTIAQHAERHKDFTARLANASKRLLETQASVAEAQANALLDSKAYDASAGLADIASLQAEVNALRVAVDKTGTALENARATEKRDRLSAATEAWNQAVRDREADIGRAMATICAGMSRLQAQGVPAKQFANWITAHRPKFLHHTLQTEAMAQGIGRLERAHSELHEAGGGGGNDIGNVLNEGLPLPDRAAIDEAAESFLPVVVTE